mmetsp:Transcript_3589/g.10502  ORF Transcript_3589/g.10502 Transcript_3589/m.10502 type:complete len:213 (+) Transcript_3589:94-732(+)
MSAPPEKKKVVFLGDEAAGKTSLVRRYMYDTFEESIQATIGMDFQSKTVYLEDRTLRLQLWDTAGQERFRSLIPSYIRDAAAAVVVYDITRRKSFDGIRRWVEEVRNERGESALIALVGNKSDLSPQREVKEDEGRQLAKELGILFAETSAKLGNGVKELFQLVAAKMPSDNAGGGGGGAESGAGTGAHGGIQLRAEPANDSARKKKKDCQC